MKKKFIVISVIIVVLLVVFLTFRNISLGFKIESIIYDMTNGSQTIELGIPKLSFMRKENDKSYSYKNIRSSKVLERELNDYLKTLKTISCNNTKYYYDEKNDFTIIDYKIEKHFIYNTISYNVSYLNYCEYLKINEYSKYIDIATLHTMNADNGVQLNEENIGTTTVQLLDEVPHKENNYQFTIKMRVLYITKSTQAQVIEDSEGTYEIKDGKLIYYREKMNPCKDESIIPKVSTFTIKDKILILDENYLLEYEDEIILE